MEAGRAAGRGLPRASQAEGTGVRSPGLGGVWQMRGTEGTAVLMEHIGGGTRGRRGPLGMRGWVPGAPEAMCLAELLGRKV